MERIKGEITPTLVEAIGLIVIVIGMMSVSMIGFGAVPHIPMIGSIIVLFVYGLLKKVSFKKMQTGLAEGTVSGINAVFLFLFIGLLISALLISGAIPTLMYYGLSMAELPFYFAIVFAVTSIIGISIGSSLTTAATLGVVFISISSALDVSLAITAGAVVSGAFFGDKMSPLSDTTNLASTVVGVDLFEHIKNMSWTTVPAFIISLLLFMILSPEASAATSEIEMIRGALEQSNLVHVYSLLPIVLLFILAIRKIPALLSLIITSLFSIALSYVHTATPVDQLFGILFGGFSADTGNEAVNSLLSRGGLESMFFTISLVLLALGLGGMLFKAGVIQKIFSMVRSNGNRGKVLLQAGTTAVGTNVLVGEQYLSILLTGEAFAKRVDESGLRRKNLSRVLEDAGTVINPLVPWGVCGVFLTDVLGVATLDYLPFAFFCLICPLLTILFSITGWTISKAD
ncbi:Na+/H+ antiporter NhaC [Jeotgalibacillus sp. R-1-5s-1]|uniref:Na+/H+ antiporter NhaC n=1 Tax=Jeotgalibacillus sp. R-1-5s-1 TaxID=2555897 RepID=UPI001068F7CE|nr:Na+/H+ antiporter NhaC [Jeotgalibacillus sp. R-1-5s-1]TFE03695.1 Na+/H+ antiporter NhaC [Jeotgalibacillus sp. R-1-5s-1]